MSKETDNDKFARAVQHWLGVKVDGWAGVTTLDAFLTRTGLSVKAPPIVGLLTPEEFARWAPSAVPGSLTALLTAAEAHDIKGRALASFLGQYYHESGGFAKMTESMNYSVAGLRATFGDHRITDAECAKFGRTAERPADQQAIANIVYGGEWGKKNLGNVNPGDGWRYRARGYGGTTGRANYREFGHEANPDALLDPVISAEASAKFFVTRGCVAPALAGDDKLVTKKINGGDNGLADRVLRTKHAMELL